MKHGSHHDFESYSHHSERPYGGRRGRLFEAGRMKLLVLYLIAQAPKHGYELIKDISELVGGGYSPSAGTIYPTLTYLEDMGFVQVKLTDGERKQFYITETGQGHLNEQQTVIQQLLEKLETKREIQTQDELLDIHRAMENLKTSLRLKLHTKSVDAETVRRIAEQIDAAAVAISRL